MRHAQIHPDWLRPWQPPRSPLSTRMASAAGRGVGRLAVEGGKRAGARWRPGLPLILALVAHAAAGVLWVLRWLHVGDRSWTLWAAAGIAVCIALAMVWPWRLEGQRVLDRRRAVRWRGFSPRLLRWSPSRRAWLAVGSTLLLAYLPVTAWWTIGPPVIYLSPTLPLGIWAWSYYGWYRIREVVEDEPDDEETPETIWADHIGVHGGPASGSRLTQVRDITTEDAA